MCVVVFEIKYCIDYMFDYVWVGNLVVFGYVFD